MKGEKYLVNAWTKSPSLNLLSHTEIEFGNKSFPVDKTYLIWDN